MSLTATVLHNLPITLPKGRRITHRFEDSKPATRVVLVATARLPVKTTSHENCERTHAAIVAGCRTVRAIQDATGLGKTTIWRAINQLEAWPTGPRITRDQNRKPSQFSPAHA